MGCSSSRCIPLSSALPSSAACQLGFYKSAPGDQLCAKCPLHSHSESRAARVCRCDSSFYRAVQDPPSAACTREYPSCTQQMLQAELIMHPCLCACCPQCCSSLSTLRFPLAHEFRPHELCSLTARCLILLRSRHPCPESAPVPGLLPPLGRVRPRLCRQARPLSHLCAQHLHTPVHTCGVISPWEAVHQHGLLHSPLLGWVVAPGLLHGYCSALYNRLL